MGMDIDVSYWPSQGHLIVPWPVPGVPNQIQCFEKAETWLAFLSQCDLHAAVPLPTATKYLRAQKLYAYAWLEYDFIKAAELVALSALEGALCDCYGRVAMKVRKNGNDRKEPMLAELMNYMIEHDGLTDDVFPFALRYRQRKEEKVVSALYETDASRQVRSAAMKASVKDPSIFPPPEPMTLAAIRNGLAHGAPLEGWPWGGLLEIVRDLIEYAYRGRIKGSP
ncbi:hypothetical protein ACN9MB_13475 [Dyella kyungheensis]|uniref:hypothetical protein n=1 Tax=Dyella kyungheensis TaxID=1242174 RepID=UPI003CF3777C